MGPSKSFSGLHENYNNGGFSGVAIKNEKISLKFIHFITYKITDSYKDYEKYTLIFTLNCGQ